MISRMLVVVARKLIKAIRFVFHVKPKRNVMGELPWIAEEKFGNVSGVTAVPLNTVAWFIPPVGKGSGGHLNIFRFIDFLERNGYNCHIVICYDGRGVSAEIAAAEIKEWFYPLKASVFMHPKDTLPAVSMAIATGWQTAFVVNKFQGCRQRVYFVQDYEPWFYGAGAIAEFAEETYRYGFPAITAGGWLASLLAREYGMKTYSVGFAVDHHLFSPRPKQHRIGKHVFFYARPPTVRRGFELGLLALEKLSRKRPDLTVHFAGWPMKKFKIPFKHVDHGILPLEKLAELYSSCDAALVFSFSNLSLLPLEIMACGCPVVSNRGPNVEWLLNEEVALLVEPTVEAVGAGLERLIDDHALRQCYIERGLELAGSLDWEGQGAVLTESLRTIEVDDEREKNI